ncbi:MAG: iron ABC transporter [Planctomycetota bacterium]|nr:MAG: iron ABC transporter [Planctomycetota bacterium]
MKQLTRRSYVRRLALGGLLVAAVVAISPGIGNQASSVGVVEAWRSFARRGERPAPPIAYQIGFRLRMPRTLLALEAGITLALCGAVFQTLFRNALATPYTLGIASGGSLGALLAIRWDLAVAFLGVSAVTWSAFIGSLAVIAIVFLFTRGTRRLTTNELLLAGVTLGMFCSAMMMLVTSLSSVRQTFEIIRWMMGSLDTIGNLQWTSNLPLLVPAWIVLVAMARPLNQYVLGEDLAATRGVNVLRLQLICILFASLATAAIVAICGPIGFVGLVVPHVTALLFGRDCRILLPMSALLGGVFLAVCDWISQAAMSWAGALTGQSLGVVVLPIGVVTAVVGVPIFLVLLHRRAV